MRDSFPPVQVGMDSMPFYKRINRLSSARRASPPRSFLLNIRLQQNPSCEGLQRDFTQRIDRLSYNFKKIRQKPSLIGTT